MNYRDGKKDITFIPKKGKTMDTCATISDKYICCNVKVLKSVSNCPFDCSYCFLQNYLTDTRTTVIDDTKALLDEVKEKTKKEPNRLFRIGTWELGDSLALEEKTGQAQKLILEFRKLPNALLELKTKSDVVDPILGLDHQERTVVSWSLNTDFIVRTEEHKTASLSDRLKAMKKCADAGYLIGAHFDPMILHNNWEEEYDNLAKGLYEHVSPDRIAWISIGSLRFNPEQKKKMENNFPGSNITAPEMVLGDDGKMRYVKPKRIEMYQFFYSKLLEYGGDDQFVYLCMERWDVWERIMGYSPRSIDHLDYLFAKSLKDRYDIGSTPKLEDYTEYSLLNDAKA